MSDAPRRPVLKLKNPPPTPSRWKCKPCGAMLELTGREAPTETIRCPACNARLGVVADFRSSEGSARVRARKLPAART